jgi:hypothetical protein
VAVVPTDAGLDVAAEALLRRRLAAAAHRDVDLVRGDDASTLLKWRVEALRAFATAVGGFLERESRSESEPTG